MKRAALFAVLLLVPGAFGQVAWQEDFEGQTPGSPPSSSDYSFSGTSNVAASGGNPGQYLPMGGNQPSERDRIYLGGFDLCDAGSTIQLDVYAASVGSSIVGTLIGFSSGDPGTGSYSNSIPGMHVIWSGADWNLQIAQGFSSSQSLWPDGKIDVNNWNTFTFSDFDCTSTPRSMSVLLENGLGTFSTTYTATQSSPANLRWLFNGEQNTFSPSWPNSRFDNVIVNGQILFGVDPPTGLNGEVTKAGSVSTTGKAVLEWNLSPDDTNQDTGDLDYHIYLDGVKIATDTIDENDGGGIRQYTYTFTGSSTFGLANFTVTAQGLYESDPSCMITLDLDDLGSQDACGLAVLAGSSPAEFDTGLVAAIETFGFFTKESKHLFTLFLVGAVTVVTGSGMKLVAPSRWKNYAILGAGATAGAFTVLIAFLDLWEFIVALMIGVFAVQGAGEARNTYFELREAMEARKAPEAQEVPVLGSDEPGGLLPDDFEEFNVEVEKITDRIDAELEEIERGDDQ